jgi:hypothetical protein
VAIPADLVRGGRFRAASAAPGLYEWFVHEALESARVFIGTDPDSSLPAEGREAARGLLAMAAVLSALERRGPFAPP